MFSACVSVSGISSCCEPEVTAKPLLWRVGGEPQRGAEMQSSGERVGGTPEDHEGKRQRRIYCCLGGTRGIDTVEKKEDTASISMEKMRYEGRIE